jgi:Flp pilus assembly pilin Flp
MASIAQRARSQRDGSSAVRSLVRDEAGIGTTEYVIILALIAIGAIAAWRGFGASVRAKVNTGTGEVASLEGVGGGGGGGGGGSGGGSSIGGGSGGGSGGNSGSSGSGSSGSGGAGAGGNGASGSGAGGAAGSSGASGSGGAGAAAGAAGGGAAGAGAAGAGGAGAGGSAGAGAAPRSNSNVASGGASDVERANEQLDQQAAEELRQRRLIAFGVALLCLLSLIGLAVYNTWRAKKIREEAAKQKAQAAKQAAYALQNMDGMSSSSFAPPPPTVGGGASDSLADITIPPPPKS